MQSAFPPGSLKLTGPVTDSIKLEFRVGLFFQELIKAALLIFRNDQLCLPHHQLLIKKTNIMVIVNHLARSKCLQRATAGMCAYPQRL